MSKITHFIFLQQTYSILIFSETISRGRFTAILNYYSKFDNKLNRCTGPRAYRYAPICVVLIMASRNVVWKVDWQNIEQMEIHSSTDRRLVHEKSFTWKCCGQLPVPSP